MVSWSDLRQDERRLHAGRQVLAVLQAFDLGVPFEGQRPSATDIRDALEGLDRFVSCTESTQAALVSTVLGTSKEFVFSDLKILLKELASALNTEEQLLLAEV